MELRYTNSGSLRLVSSRSSFLKSTSSQTSRLRRVVCSSLVDLCTDVYSNFSSLPIGADLGGLFARHESEYGCDLARRILGLLTVEQAFKLFVQTYMKNDRPGECCVCYTDYSGISAVQLCSPGGQCEGHFVWTSCVRSIFTAGGAASIRCPACVPFRGLSSPSRLTSISVSNSLFVLRCILDQHFWC